MQPHRCDLQKFARLSVVDDDTSGTGALCLLKSYGGSCFDAFDTRSALCVKHSRGLSYSSIHNIQHISAM